jgi:hypothetical protein
MRLATSASLCLLLAAAATTSVSAQNVSNTNTTTDADAADAADDRPLMYDLCDVPDYYKDFLAKSTNPLEWLMEDLALHVEATHRNMNLPNIAEVRGEGTCIY